ncbi:sugar phosphate phosphatase [Enterococcus florum]|uniref:Sugar phosphate phosphatase n=1 Tax=Enterococcus florum TaxID=2480627 RepID=A0A4P5PAB7_9ENTE|nr:Cof-type HAD-IIB family hydrolase [Enterococcus florum]GCF93181.1 sugar phosphate phosphatase [Enterococcus florum]
MNLIALDLDGTTLDEKGTMTPEVQAALTEISQDPELQIVFCSGRPYSGIHPFIKAAHLPEENYHVLVNGAIIQSGLEETLCESLLSRADYQEVLAVCEEKGLLVAGVTDHGVYTTSTTINPAVMIFCVLTHNPLFVRRFEELPKQPRFSKLIICEEPDIIKQNKQALLQVFGDRFSCVQGYEAFLEVSKKGTSKGAALLELANYYHVAVDNVFVVGDNENDLSTFEQFPNSFAMGNAVPELKAIAKWHCPTNDENGVIKALETIQSVVDLRRRQCGK